MIQLSVVFGTYNRLDCLTKCLSSVRSSVGKMSYEIVVVDGGSDDGTLYYLKEQKDVKLIEQGELLGPVAAYNAGFASTAGKYVAFLNDDLFLEDQSLLAACKLLDEQPKVGLVAIPYREPGGTPKVATCTAGNPPKKWLFASFGALRRELGEQIGWFDGFYHYNGDCHLALSIWDMGLQVVALEGYSITHLAKDNAIRGQKRWDVPNARRKTFEDWKLFGERWGNWNGPYSR